MSRAAKWIIGTLLGLVVLAAIVLGGFWLFSWLGRGFGMFGPRGMMPFYGGPEMPFRGMHPYRGFFPFGGLRILGLVAGGLICLGFLALIVVGVIALAGGIGRRSGPTEAPASITPPPAAAVRTCPNCGRPVQEDWSHCPYCGEDLTVPNDVPPET